MKKLIAAIAIVILVLIPLTLCVSAKSAEETFFILFIEAEDCELTVIRFIDGNTGAIGKMIVEAESDPDSFTVKFSASPPTERMCCG